VKNITLGIIKLTDATGWLNSGAMQRVTARHVNSSRLQTAGALPSTQTAKKTV